MDKKNRCRSWTTWIARVTFCKKQSKARCFVLAKRDEAPTAWDLIGSEFHVSRKKTFQGDSGGPLTVEHGGVHILAGIASFGPKKIPVPPSRVPLRQVQSKQPNTFSFSAVSCCICPSRRSYFIFGISHKVRMCSLACLTFFLGSTPLSCPMGASTLATSPSLLRRIVVQTHAVSLSFV